MVWVHFEEGWQRCDKKSVGHEVNGETRQKTTKEVERKMRRLNSKEKCLESGKVEKESALHIRKIR